MAWLGTLIMLIYFASLLLGFFFCIKQSFTEGVVFFAILFVLEIANYVLALNMESLLTSLSSSSQSAGQIVSMMEYARNVIQVVAFVILTAGFYRRWRRMEARNEVHHP